MGEMGQAIEVVGADVEAAIEAGLIQLGVGRDAVDIEVLDDGSRGLFGLGARDARVRLTIKSPAEPQQPPAPTVAEPDDSLGRVDAVPVAESTKPAFSVPEEKDQAEVARGVLLDLLALMDLGKAQVGVRYAEPAAGEKDPPLVLEVQGPGTDVLIGRRGKTMAALQHITRLIVGRETEGWVHLVVDVGGFKARREKSLRRLARRTAEQALRTGRTVVLEPMPPHERRIIHLALRDHPDVVTESVGERDRRKVTIIPR
jgi:spoIIIJ-associated protein